MSWMADGEALGISRASMDRILMNRAQELGVEVREGFTVSSKLTVEGGWRVIEGSQDGGSLEMMRGRVIIDASGRNGVFSRQVSQEASRFNGARVFGCKVHLRRIRDMEGLGELYFFGDGYGGLSDIEDERSNLCFLTTEKSLIEARGDRERLLDLTVRANPAARARLKDAEAIGEWHGTGPITYGRQQTMSGILAVGDSSAFIDPFTGSGMLLALASGELAANVIDHHLSDRATLAETIIADYQHRHRSLFSRRYRTVSLLRKMAFSALPRQMMVSVLSRQQSLARLIARSTRAGH